ncbi:hypothetical protein NLJ89_g10778 [Agrocybe chaxingu]|uniref:Uncharacterized protein n=1 Tax=Agrocybe chaxingu TaxID=84603 RepID=A0A9W8MSA3_9AGAR|nr:hypothetical protein NLJ89_g10778 [Agrocybe chaxingu]
MARARHLGIGANYIATDVVPFLQFRMLVDSPSVLSLRASQRAKKLRTLKVVNPPLHYTRLSPAMLPLAGLTEVLLTEGISLSRWLEVMRGCPLTQTGSFVILGQASDFPGNLAGIKPSLMKDLKDLTLKVAKYDFGLPKALNLLCLPHLRRFGLGAVHLEDHDPAVHTDSLGPIPAFRNLDSFPLIGANLLTSASLEDAASFAVFALMAGSIFAPDKRSILPKLEIMHVMFAGLKVEDLEGYGLTWLSTIIKARCVAGLGT